MKPAVAVMSRSRAEDYTLDRHDQLSVIISINNIDDRLARVGKTSYNKVLDVLYCKFDDTDKLDGNNYGITKYDTMQIKEFVNKYKDIVDIIIVHCGAGQSRSAGIAGAILKYLYNDDTQIFNNHSYTPNMRCYRMLLEAFMEESINFYDAWHFLENHKVFNGCFQECYDIEVVKVNQDIDMVDDDSSKNTKTQIWLECGPWDPDCRTHNIDLDCGGDTFEDAIINLAILVKNQYGE